MKVGSLLSLFTHRIISTALDISSSTGYKLLFLINLDEIDDATFCGHLYGIGDASFNQPGMRIPPKLATEISDNVYEDTEKNDKVKPSDITNFVNVKSGKQFYQQTSSLYPDSLNPSPTEAMIDSKNSNSLLEQFKECIKNYDTKNIE